MSISQETLKEKFQLLNDEELLQLFHSGDLTHVAREVAAAELEQRGVDLQRPKGEAACEKPSEMRHQELLATSEGDFVLVARFATPIEAHVLQSRLVAEGVPAIVADAHMVGANPFLSIAVGGVRVLVPESHLDRADEIVKAVQRGDYALDDQADVG